VCEEELVEPVERAVAAAREATGPWGTTAALGVMPKAGPCMSPVAPCS
jgi:hypothetical protein